MTRSVLVVDDHAAVAASAAHALTASGCVARVALSVRDALAELAAGPADAVVLDHWLGDGDDAAMLRHALVRSRRPVLLVSGLDDETARGVAATHGWAFLPKPFLDDELVTAVAALFPTETPVPDRPSPDPRASIVPDLPPAPASIAPREAPLPAPPPAAQLTPSGRPVNVPVVVQAIDRLGDIVGVIAVAHLCALGKIGGVEAVIAIGAILGVGTGLRQAGARAGAGAGVGVVGLLLLGFARWLAPAAGAAEIARASGVFGLLAVLALGGCGGTADVAALGAATTAIKVAAEVRRHLCSPVLDPLLGDPRPAPDGGPAAPAPVLPPLPVAAPSRAAEGDAGLPNDAPADAAEGDQ